VLASLSPARRRFVLTLLVGVLAVAVAAAGVRVIRRAGSGGVHPVRQDLAGPVLLVPGYGGALQAVRILAETLRQNGRDATVVELAGDGRGDLRTQAKVLAAAAERSMSRSGAESVDVVGYSAGGVVARLWVREYGGASVARRVLTLGSPHHGTTVADLAVETVGCPTACRQLAPDSDLLRRLNAGDETPLGPRFISIWSTADDVVTPPDSARLDGALNLTVQGLCPAAQPSHASLPTHPVVLTLVVAELGTAPPAVPADLDCDSASS